VTKFIDFNVVEKCDFVKPDAKHYKEAIFNYDSGDQENILSYAKTHGDVFLVIDNSGWLAATQGMRPNGVVGDVIFDLKLETNFTANGFYKTVFKFSLICIGCLSVLVIIMISLYICETKRYNRLMEEKKEFKQQQLLKKNNSETRALFS
jgi:hypothetical protein